MSHQSQVSLGQFGTLKLEIFNHCKKTQVKRPFELNRDSQYICLTANLLLVKFESRRLRNEIQSGLGSSTQHVALATIVCYKNGVAIAGEQVNLYGEVGVAVEIAIKRKRRYKKVM